MLQLILVAVAALLIGSFVLAILLAGIAMVVTGLHDWLGVPRLSCSFELLRPILLGLVLMLIGGGAIVGVFLLCQRGC